MYVELFNPDPLYWTSLLIRILICYIKQVCWFVMMQVPNHENAGINLFELLHADGDTWLWKNA